MSVRLNNQPITTFRFATTPEDLAEAKLVDDLAFGPHHGITMNELSAISEGAGFVGMLLEGQDVIAESQILLSQLEGMNWVLPDKAAFCYGIATHPAHQGKGLGKRLLTTVLQVAAQKADTVYTTIRVENYPSLKLFMGVGHEIIGYLPFYGEGLADHRFLLKMNLLEAAAPELHDPVVVPVRFGDEVDASAHRQVYDLFGADYRGVSVSKSGIVFARP